MEYEIGKWYITTDNRKCLFYVTKIEYNEDEERDFLYAYGFDWQGKWVTDETEYTDDISYDPKTERLATREEIKEALIKEGEKRGLKEGILVMKPKFGKAKLSGSYWTYNHSGAKQSLSFGADFVFYNGEWAEIIEQEEEVKDKSMKYKIGEIVLVYDDIAVIKDYDSGDNTYYIYFQDDTEYWVAEFEISPMNNQNDKGKEKYEIMNEFEEMELAYKNAERLNNLQTPVNANAAKAINPGVNGRHRDGFTVNRPARTMDFASSKYNRRR